ncbi:MAG: Abi family protein [Arenicella sp.]
MNASLQNYAKPALTFDQQLDQLIARGLQVGDRAKALSQLDVISYYRLSAYWHPFRLRDQQGRLPDDFIAGSSLTEVLRLYEFDRGLRLLLMDAIERIEVAVRTRMTYFFAHKYGAFGYVDADNFHPRFNHAFWLNKICAEVERSSEQFIHHYRQTYSGFPHLPIWMATEVASLGALSYFYSGLKHDDKREVADYFGQHHIRLADWLHSLTYVRNVCAHHSRLWNRELAIRSSRIRDPNWQSPLTPRNDRIFYVLLIVRQLLTVIGDEAEWTNNMQELILPIASNPFYAGSMGLPEDWLSHPLWVN